MKLTIIGSSSQGNGYILKDSRGRSLLLEAGVPFSLVKKALAYRVGDVEGLLVTHEHGDHSKHIGKVLKDSAIPVYASQGTADAIAPKLQGMRKTTSVESGKTYTTGSFSFIPMELSVNGEMTHDAAQPFCYLIHHPEMGTTLFATDTYTLPCRFDDVRHVIIECNYAMSILDRMTREGKVDGKRRKRTIQSHMELSTCIHELTTNINLDKVLDITLIHLSDTNSDPERFSSEIAVATGKTVRIAEAGQEFEMNEKPF